MRKKRLMIAIACIILVGIAVIVIFFTTRGKNRIRIWTQRRLFPLKCY